MTLRVELAERKAQAPVLTDREQRAGLGAVVGRLPAAGLEQIRDLIGADRSPELLPTQFEPLHQ